MKLLPILLLVSISHSSPLVRFYVPYGGVDSNIYGSYEDKVRSIDKVKRIFIRKTKQKFRTKKIRYCIPFEERFLYQSICSSWDHTPVQCIRAIYGRIKNNGYKKDSTLHYYVALPILFEGSYWIGGAAQTACYKHVRMYRNEFNAIAGIAYGNYLKTQINGTSRLSQSEAVKMHELGHLICGLSHDLPEEEYIMNSLFNVKGFSSKSSPELWRFSPRSLKEVRRCKKA